MAVLRGWAVSYERGTPVDVRWNWFCSMALLPLRSRAILQILSKRFESFASSFFFVNDTRFFANTKRRSVLLETQPRFFFRAQQMGGSVAGPPPRGQRDFIHYTTSMITD